VGRGVGDRVGEGEEVRRGQDMGPGHQEMGCAGVVGDRWRMGQGLVVHGDIVVVREVVHHIAGVPEGRRGVVGRQPVGLGVVVHIVRHLRLVGGGDVIAWHRGHIAAWKPKHSFQGPGVRSGISRCRRMVGRLWSMVGRSWLMVGWGWHMVGWGWLMVGWGWLVVGCVYSEYFFKGASMGRLGIT
jgi:hypothetical protein